MYQNVISYRLAENISGTHLLGVADDIAKSWMSKQPGFIKWEIHKNDDGGYTDIVYWNSETDSKKSGADMANIPNANNWYACYEKDSMSCKNLSRLATFN